MRRELRESLPGIRIQGLRHRSPGLRRFGKRPTLPRYTHMIRPKYPVTSSYADKKSGSELLGYKYPSSSQVHPPFVSEDAWNEIEARLSTHLHKNANVQVSCDLPFFSKGSLSFMASGFADAVENNTVFELKFVSALAHTHFLQCASYMAAMDIPRGILWNVRTNQMFEITIPNRQAFLNKVVNAVTKGRIGRYLEPEKQNPKPAGKQQVKKSFSAPPSQKSSKKKGQPKVVVKKKIAEKRELIKTPNEPRIVGGKRVWDLPG